jgi:hypothetical protein
MKTGDIVAIYEHPLTGKGFEGKAKLLKRIREASPGCYLEYWRVKFNGPEEHPVDRFILP